MKSKRKISSEEESKVSNINSNENEEEVEIDDDFEESKSEDESQEEIETEEEALDDGKHGAKDDEHKRGESRAVLSTPQTPRPGGAQRRIGAHSFS